MANQGRASRLIRGIKADVAFRDLCQALIVSMFFQFAQRGFPLNIAVAGRTGYGVFTSFAVWIEYF